MLQPDTVEKKIAFIKKYMSAQNAATGSDVDQNANVSDKNIATLAAELPKKDNILLQRAIMQEFLRKLYPDSHLDEWYIKDLDHHIIYRHDETSGAGGFPYCASITLYPFIMNGLKGIGGTSSAPKHTDSFIGGILNLIFGVAAQFVGAIAVPEFLTYMDHFLRIDFGDDYIDHLDEVIEKRGKHSRTLKERIQDWFGQFTYTINQPAAARGNQSVFLNIAYFDEGYFKAIFKDFVFPDGDEPKWETTKELQKMYMKWFNAERLKSIITFPVETANMLVDKETHQYKDEEMAQFFSEMWAEGASFFMYQSDSADSLSSCCRLRNGIEDNIFSYTLGAGGIKTGSKAVITLNINRIVQDWDNSDVDNLEDYLKPIVNRVHKYLKAFNAKLWNDYKNGILTIYNAGFIDLDSQYLTVGINGFIEGAEFLKIKPDPRNKDYQQYAYDILNTIENANKAARDEHAKFNLEFVPAEGLGPKNAKWDKKDGYWVPRDCYNSYFYPVEDKSLDPIIKFFYQGKGFADICSGGVALHNNLDEHLSAAQYRKLMDVAVQAGCNYFTYNVMNTICNDCGYISKHTFDHCPKCGSHNVDYATRIIGYLKRISNFSAARQIEADNRAYGDLTHKEAISFKEIKKEK